MPISGCQTGSPVTSTTAKNKGGGPMNLLLINFVLPSFLASPGHTVYDEILRSSGWRSQRRSTKSLVPAYSIYTAEFAAIEDPPAPPQRPIPTDVPVKEPNDVPLREPLDVPPGPEAPVSPPTKEPHDTPPHDPQGRPIP